jgi:hypothetical protein
MKETRKEVENRENKERQEINRKRRKEEGKKER